MSVSADPRIGAELLGYRLEALLGRGGMSVVYRAEDLRLKRRVAIKLLAPELAEDEHFRERFLRESELAASLDHSSIVPIYHAGEVDGQLYIAMRYVQGGDLKTLLGSGLEPKRAVDLLAQVADALDAAHEAGLVHRDVKPRNVLLDTRDHCYLADFGLTKQVSSQSGFTGTGQIVGTIDYVAPEVIEGKGLDARSDLYSFACLLYECLAGEPPFHRDSEFAVLWAHVNEPPPKLSERRPELGTQVDAVLAKALAKDPARRYGSARELVEAVRRALPAPEAPHRSRRRRLLLAAAAIPLVAAAIALPLLLTRGGGGPSTKPTLVPLVDSLQHIDPATNRLVATLPQGPHGSGSLAASRHALWVAPRESTVLRIDPRSGRTTATISTGEGTSPGPGVANLTYDGRRLVWAASYAVLIPINPVKGTLIAVGAFTAGAELATSNNVFAVDATSAVINAWVDYRSHEGNLLHYSATDNGTPVSAGKGTPMAMTLGFDSLWVSEFNPATLVRVGANPASPVLATMDLPFDPVPGGLAAGGGSVWISDAAGGRLVRIDPARRRIVQTIRVGRYPTAVTWGVGSVWVANNEDGTVSRVDPRSRKVIATIGVGPHPTAIAVGADGVWVAVHSA